MSARACETCGGPLPPPKIPAPPRRFCSDHCRKLQYAGTCIDCGAPTNGSNGRGPSAPKCCATCNTRRGTEGWVRRANARRARIAALWAEGVTLREIAADLDTTVNSLGSTMVQMRAGGWDLPYRYKIRNGRRAAA